MIAELWIIKSEQNTFVFCCEWAKPAVNEQ